MTRPTIRPPIATLRRAVALPALLGLLATTGLVAQQAATNPAAAGGPPLVTHTVTTTEDEVDPADGLLSLREALDLANGDADHSELQLQAGATYELDHCAGDPDENLNVGGDLDHTDDHILVVQGNGATIEQTCTGERVLHDFDPDWVLQLFHLRITGGRTAGSGGGVMFGGTGYLAFTVVEGNQSGGANGGGGVAANLTAALYGSTVRDNVAGGNGGGVRAFNGVNLTASTVDHNAAAGSGGGVSAGTGMNVQRSTVTANRAIVSGGGLHAASQHVELGSSTVTANRAPDGANVHADEEITMNGSIVALGSEGTDCLSGDPVVNGGGNVGFDPTCGAADPEDVAALHPQVSQLSQQDDQAGATFGGTEVQRPIVGSPSIDRYAPACFGAQDQHDHARPQDGACDAGAFEGAAAACAPQFSDVTGGHPFFEEICWLAQSGITTGFGDGSFGASQAVSRQAMAAFIYRLALSPPPPLLAPTFGDVGLDHPFGTEIGWLADEGITTGFPDGGFHPGAQVTRQAMAAFLFRVAGEPAVALPPAPTFPDVPETHPFWEPIEWMAGAGVSTGYGDGTWRPSDPVTRQAMAAFLERMADQVELRGL